MLLMSKTQVRKARYGVKRKGDKTPLGFSTMKSHQTLVPIVALKAHHDPFLSQISRESQGKEEINGTIDQEGLIPSAEVHPCEKKSGMGLRLKTHVLMPGRLSVH